MTFGRDCKKSQSKRYLKKRRRGQYKSSLRRNLRALLLFPLAFIIYYLVKEDQDSTNTSDISDEQSSNIKATGLATVSKTNASLRKAGRWEYIVIHHSGIDIGDKARYSRYHKEKYNSDSLLYHFIIGNGFGKGLSDGKIEIGSRWERQEAGGHVTDDFYNQHGIGICLVGNLSKHEPTKNQMASLFALVQYLMGKFNIPSSNILMHKEINSTDCPGEFFPKNAFMQSVSNISLLSKKD